MGMFCYYFIAFIKMALQIWGLRMHSFSLFF